jgi:hypothetical protein
MGSKTAKTAIGIVLVLAMAAPGLPCDACCCASETPPAATPAPDDPGHACCKRDAELGRVVASAATCACDQPERLPFEVPEAVAQTAASDGRNEQHGSPATLPTLDPSPGALIAATQRSVDSPRGPDDVLHGAMPVTRGPPSSPS